MILLLILPTQKVYLRSFSVARKLTILIFILVFPIFSFAFSEVGTIEIIDQEGVPCFKVSDNYTNKYGEYQYAFVLVSERRIDKNVHGKIYYEVIWNSPIFEKNTQYKLNSCIKYSENFGKKDIVKSERLETGKLYSAIVSAKPISGEAEGVLSYRGEFCLLKIKDGKVKVHQIKNEKNDDFCSSDGFF